jgi:hypothetical protein
MFDRKILKPYLWAAWRPCGLMLAALVAAVLLGVPQVDWGRAIAAILLVLIAVVVVYPFYAKRRMKRMVAPPPHTLSPEGRADIVRQLIGWLPDYQKNFGVEELVSALDQAKFSGRESEYAPLRDPKFLSEACAHLVLLGEIETTTGNGWRIVKKP